MTVRFHTAAVITTAMVTTPTGDGTVNLRGPVRRSGGSFLSYFQTMSIGRFPDQYTGSIDFITVLEEIFMGILCRIIF